MKIYHITFGRNRFYQGITPHTGRKFCLVCARDLPGGAVFPDTLTFPYVGQYDGEDFDSIEFALPHGGGFLLATPRVLEIIKDMGISVRTYPAVLRSKNKKDSRQKEMIGVEGAFSVELDPVAFRKSRNVDCPGCGRTSWYWSGNQGKYLFKGARSKFHLFCLAGYEPQAYFSEDFIKELRLKKVRGVPSLRGEKPFGEWTAE